MIIWWVLLFQLMQVITSISSTTALQWDSCHSLPLSMTSLFWISYCVSFLMKLDDDNDASSAYISPTSHTLLCIGSCSSRENLLLWGGGFQIIPSDCSLSISFLSTWRRFCASPEHSLPPPQREIGCFPSKRFHNSCNLSCPGIQDDVCFSQYKSIWWIPTQQLPNK